MRWAELVAGAGDKENVHRVLVRRLEKERHCLENVGTNGKIIL